jgi:hypothetical protein
MGLHSTTYKRIGLADDHRCREDLLAANPSKLPNAGEGEGLEIFAAEAIRLLAVIALLPLIEAGSRDNLGRSGRR